ncbi:MAG TPA: carboxypeptidase-like regulatory domain-containing protein, partial [Prolixibacteraceae bacterium]|nr:carboxypeptidase-like regulatory domain-containing protein [Prolixibacteraceae bacterium]
MKKKWINPGWCSSVDLTQTLRIMKLTIFIIFVALLQSPASTYSQNTRLKIVGQNLTLEKIFDMIEDQSDFSFFYNVEQIDHSKKMDMNEEDQLVDKILNDVLEGTDLTYTINNKLIVIHKQSEDVEAMVQQDNTQKRITGKVVDQSGSPIPGVSVVVKGTTIGTVTDNNGGYSIQVPATAKTIVYSFVGMEVQEVSIEGKSVINISMSDLTVGIEEVVAIGYGTMKKSDLTGSVVRADMNALKESPNVSLTQSLQGVVPGLNVGMVTSAGEDASITVRGRNTISGTNSPLIVLDGIIYRGNLVDINPNDIESVDVLKDASSTAIYGSQASNGVLIITSKKGKDMGKPIVSYSGSYAYQTPSHEVGLGNSDDYISKIKSIYLNTA